ncbi:MAG: 16S rRNA pseudouridine(516) synthase RsuA [Candidatus Competibacterales bacterium]|nr:16S rRNA pseudouridine(516) synthase RsuA [Candidatus Competibacterales bacterium]
MRLDRYLSQATGLTRKQVRGLIRTGAVTVAGAPMHDPARHIDPDQAVALDGAEVATPAARYFMLHKPAGVVCATRDGRHPTVLDLLDEPRPEALQIAGRLDRDATGLVLITDDGPWNHRLTSPRHHCPKTYLVTLAEALDAKAADHLRRGVWLERERQRCRPAEVEPLSPGEIRLTLTEGRYHQVKRMLAAVGNRVTALHRERIGALALDPELAPGAYRPLDAREIAST